MFYAIDFDSLLVESKSENKKELQSYIVENDLELAVAIISSKEELVVKFSFDELQVIFDNLSKAYGAKHRKFDYEDEASDYIWNELEENQNEFKKFTKSLGKKIIKQSKKPEPEDTSKPDKPIKSKPTKIKIDNKTLLAMNFILGSKSPRDGTACKLITDFIDENLGEASYSELVETFIERYVPKKEGKVTTPSYAKAYIKDCITGNFIEESL